MLEAAAVDLNRTYSVCAQEYLLANGVQVSFSSDWAQFLALHVGTANASCTIMRPAQQTSPFQSSNAFSSWFIGPFSTFGGNFADFTVPALSDALELQRN